MTADASFHWPVVWQSFAVSAVAAAAVIAWLVRRMYRYNHFAPPQDGTEPAGRPTVRDAGPGPLHDGTYRYAVTEVQRAFGRHWPFWKIESARGAASRRVVLTHAGVVEIAVQAGAETTIERRLYRRARNGEFRRVGEIKGRDEAKFLDGWNPIKLTTELTALGTNWSFKDNWVSNVTVGATALVTLLASSNTFGTVFGAAGTNALTAMAVAAGLSAVCVGVGPLIVKTVGSDLAYTTACGMLLAAFVTLVGTLGQISAITWEVWDTTSNHTLQLGVVAIAIAVGAIVLTYAEQTLWYYIKTGALYVPAATSETMKAAALIAAAIAGGPSPHVATPAEAAATAPHRTALL